MGSTLDTFTDELQVMALVGSAGGVAAVSQVLQGLPADLNAAVIVLLHQVPDRDNRLVDVLRRRSVLVVEPAQDNEPLMPGVVVVAPPGKHVLIAPGPRVVLIVSGAVPPSRPSADLLLTTLAVQCGPRATAVVMSGYGHDGATGATAIHRFGGTVLASSEASSEVFSMPEATILRDSAVDHVVAVDAVADVLAAIVAGRKL